jgi:pyridoxine 4-dehydrogenase
MSSEAVGDPTCVAPDASAAGTVRIGSFQVNRLGFGSMRIIGAGKWGPPPDRDVALSVLRHAVEWGVNFIDTADSYGPEVSERLIAEALYPYPDELVIATKGGLLRPSRDRWVRDGRPEHIRQACEASLRRLRLEQIPIYQLHWPDETGPYAESLGALVDLQRAGKIRHVAISNVSVSQLQEAQEIADVVSVQNRYNVSDRSAEGILAACEKASIPFIPYAPVQNIEGQRAVATAAQRCGVSAHQIVIAWLLARSPSMLPIPGTGSVDHLASNVSAASIRLEREEIDAITGSGR